MNVEDRNAVVGRTSEVGEREAFAVAVQSQNR